MRVLPVALQERWIAVGGDWRATASVLAGATVLATARTYIPLSRVVRDESYRWGYNPIPWLVGGFLVVAVFWALMFGSFSLGSGRQTVAESRRLASETLILFVPLGLLVSLLVWLIQ